MMKNYLLLMYIDLTQRATQLEIALLANDFELRHCYDSLHYSEVLEKFFPLAQK